MSQVSVSLPSDGETIDAADYNTPLTTLINDYNSNIDNSNISATAAIAGTKLATDGVTDTQLDYPRWWQEVGRTTLSSSGTSMSVTSIPARKYLRIVVFTIATGGNVTPVLLFNNDSGNNYSLRISDNGAADGTFVSQAGVTLYGASGTTTYSIVDVVNLSAQEKLVNILTSHGGAAGAGNTTGRRESFSKWANTAAQITRIDVNTSAANFAAGSDLIILGHD